MAITTLTSRQFQRNPSRAQKAAQDGPVFITSRGRAAHVLMSFEEYRRITGRQQKIADLLAMPGNEDIELEIPKVRELARSIDLV